MSLWFHAIRPKTLVAGAAPVCIGSALAWVDGGFVAWVAGLALVCAVLIQIASNFINELEDFKRGADARRVGPLRAVSAGLITPASMRRASWLVVATAFILGLPIVWHAGPWILAIGVACLAMAWMYTGGPFPLAYHGLGEVFALLFFGVVAVVGTYYAHTGTWSMDALIASIGPGLLAANILAVNNLRDIYSDAIANKRTLAVRYGALFARASYATCTIVAIAAPAVFLQGHRGPFLLLPLVTLPLGLLFIALVNRRSGAELNPVLGGTAFLYLMYTLCAVVGIALSRY
jgi:1,4-dihydroxy-2-naphthoate octaprenyltransferase